MNNQTIFNNVKNKKTYIKIIDQFMELLNNESLGYGDELYTEAELVEIFDVSRPTLREALRVLEFMGIITVKPKRGISINHPNSMGIYNSLLVSLQFEKIDSSDLFFLRRSIEISAAELACINRTDEDLKELEGMLSNQKVYIEEDSTIFAEHDYQFHDKLVASSKNSLFVKLLGTLNVLLREQLKDIIKDLTVEDRHRTLKFHTKIYEAIKNRNAKEAVNTMTQHMARASRLFIKRK